MSTRAPGRMPGSRFFLGAAPFQRRVKPIFKPVRALPGQTSPQTSPQILPMSGGPSPSAIIALIMSVTGLLFLVPAVGGIVLGSIELSRINRRLSPAKGRSLALAGIIIGAVVLALDIIATIVIMARGG